MLLLDAVVEHGSGTPEGRTAIRRINQMHRNYDISDDDMRYVLSLFVVMPRRWIDTYGRRRLSRHEIVAATEYYRMLGRRMGIPSSPGSTRSSKPSSTPTRRPTWRGTSRLGGSPTPGST
ncbi:hypothetical protein J2Z21_008068 [Streptomyces griseochromogenes]|uniref:ER-bound oxygenase mpaB/mpaB'/Rubber oxygenase catalytic domain-containing protein n=1 Tax=Streptomyces griseochromogenes TaxID=68214 RepID=A0ABS4M5X5_9ACTN|nr:hypothetical protein [Streptomyces griseochromogenes]